MRHRIGYTSGTIRYSDTSHRTVRVDHSNPRLVISEGMIIRLSSRGVRHINEHIRFHEMGDPITNMLDPWLVGQVYMNDDGEMAVIRNLRTKSVFEIYTYFMIPEDDVDLNEDIEANIEPDISDYISSNHASDDDNDEMQSVLKDMRL